MAGDGGPFSPAAERNRASILAVLAEVLPVPARVLEIASGTGQHAAHFAAAQPRWSWQPSDADPAALAGIAARCADLPNVRPPVRLDVLARDWPPGVGRVDAIYCANMLHISPWATCAALMRGAATHLVPGGLLVLYGPFIVDGEPVAPGNLAFDADLRARDALWGLRRMADVIATAGEHGIRFVRRIKMPANNLSIVMQRSGATAGAT